MMKMSHDKQMKNKFLRKTNDGRNMKMMKNKLFIYRGKKPFIIYEGDDEGAIEIHEMNETQRNRGGIYSHKRHKLGEIIFEI